ncbi:hypothetical protein [Treponema vincentii]|uniref:hypothetical protein n=1 Tax=Treponema vincentii TaxID=69710 RepID=UPI003D943A93
MKKICLLFVWLLAFTGAAYTKNWKYYYDDETGYSGEASITVIGDDTDGNLLDSTVDMLQAGARGLGYSVHNTRKLPKEIIWLFSEALKEYYLAKNEVYSILIDTTAPDSGIREGFIICVKIEDDAGKKIIVNSTYMRKD